MYIEVAFQYAVVAFLAWQWLIPVLLGRPTFPLFRPKSLGVKQVKRAVARKGEAEDLQEAAKIEASARRVEKKTEKLRNEE